MRPRAPPPTSVAAYRELLRKVDEELIALYAERRALVRQLWEFKALEGLPLVDPVQEQRVVTRARARAIEVGLEPDEGERLVRWILTEGRRGLPRAVTPPPR